MGANQEHLRFKRDTFRAGHLDEWTSVRPDWLEQLKLVAAPAIEGGSAVLDEFAGAIQSSDMEYEKSGEFSTSNSIRLVVEGEGGSREAVARLRDQLVGDDRFVLRNTGSDGRGGRRMPYPFGFDLRSRTLDPGTNPEDETSVDDEGGEE